MKDMFEYKQDEIEEVLACPWCSSKNYKPWGKPNRNFTPVKCDMCGVVFLNKRLNGKGRKRFYQSYVRLHETPERLKPRLRMYEIEFELINNIVTRGNVLDVGCGSGRFLSYFQPGHYKRFGVEYGKEAVNKARQTMAIESICEGDLLDAEFQEEYFDLIVFRGVLEHLPNPGEVLDKACNLTKKGGHIFITSMPNLECICAEIFKSRWTQHREFEHIIHFGKSHFRSFFKNKGFVEILDKELYWDTPYANPEDDICRVADAIRMKNEGKRDSYEISPAFWGNVLSMVFKKDYS